MIVKGKNKVTMFAGGREITSAAKGKRYIVVDVWKWAKIASKTYNIPLQNIKNAYNEDNNIIYSLDSSLGKTRWLSPNNGAFIILKNFIDCSNSKKLQGQVDLTNANGWEGTNGALQFQMSMAMSYGKCFFVGESIYTQSTYKLRAYCDNVLIAGMSRDWGVSGYSGELKLYAMGQFSGYCAIKHGITIYHEAGIREMFLIPFIRNNVNGLLNLLNNTFYANANTSGSFTIEITNN